jgi:hypothetical protein
LTTASGPTGDEGLDSIGFDGPSEQLSGAEDVFLADEIVEGSWSHARCERGLGRSGTG